MQKYLIGAIIASTLIIIATQFSPVVKYGREANDCIKDGATYMANEDARYERILRLSILTTVLAS